MSAACKFDGDILHKSNLLDIVKELENENTRDKLKSCLNTIILQGKEYEGDIVEAITLLLGNDDIEIITLSAQAVAELAKDEKKRPELSKHEIVKRLLSFLKRNIEEQTIELFIQTCRALGNLCCDCNEGRDAIQSQLGLSIVVDVFPKLLHQQSITKSRVAELHLNICKALLNFLIGGTEYVKLAVQTDLLSHLVKIFEFWLKEENPNEDVFSTALLMLNVINEELPDFVFEMELNTSVLSVLKETQSIDVSENCLDILHTQAENDTVKTYVAQAEGVQLLISKLDLLHNDSGVFNDDSEDLRTVSKLACDLIILILTGDDAMQLLYSGGKGIVYITLLQWLDCSDRNLLITAVLALGNFARADTICVDMMQEGVFNKLLDIYEIQVAPEDGQDAEEAADSGRIRLQHALLATIRNLSVHAANKARAAAEGRAASILFRSLPHVTHHHVAYKLLACIRMLVQGQKEVALQFVRYPDAVASAVAWGLRPEHPGACCEAPRLLATLTAQVNTRAAWDQIVMTDKCLVCMVNMLLAPHTVMQNEAILALTILAVASLEQTHQHESLANHTQQLSINGKVNSDDEPNVRDKFIKELIEAEIGKHITVLIETNSAKIPPEVADNLAKFLEFTVKVEELRRDFHNEKVHESLQKFVDKREDFSDALQRAIAALIGVISLH